jgi:hypothetical protein
VETDEALGYPHRGAPSRALRDTTDCGAGVLAFFPAAGDAKAYAVGDSSKGPLKNRGNPA